MTTGLGGKARVFAVDFRLSNQLKGVGKSVFFPAFHLRLELRFELENDLGSESGHGIVGSRAAVNQPEGHLNPLQMPTYGAKNSDRAGAFH